MIEFTIGPAIKSYACLGFTTGGSFFWGFLLHKGDEQMIKKLIRSAITTASLICMGICMLSVPVKAETVSEEAEAATPVYDPMQPVDIVINLEDESRYMGVSLYRIGDYDGERFTYTAQILELVDKDYYKLSRESEIIAAAESLAAIVRKDDSFEKTDVSIVDGVGVAEDLTTGLYLIVQNRADRNATLDNAYFIETPGWNEETLEFMYDVRYFPKWEREAWFTFRNEIVYPMVIIFALVSLAIFCLLGNKILKFALAIAGFMICGYYGMIVSAKYLEIEANFLWLFVLFIVFAFVGTGVVWIITSIISAIVRKLKITDIVKKNMFWLTAVTGAIGVFFILYKMVLNNLYRSIVIAAACGAIGILVQYVSKGRELRGYTYEDLYRIQLKDKEDDERL